MNNATLQGNRNTTGLVDPIGEKKLFNDSGENFMWVGTPRAEWDVPQ